MKIIVILSAFAFLLLPGGASGAGPSPKPVDRAGLAAQVRAELLSSWQAYERYA
jgi:hypothetical protein